MQNTKSRNCSIDLFRYMCAIMIVIIHTHPFMDIHRELGLIATDILPRIGVPFFFTTSGYFYTQKLANGKTPFYSYIRRLLFTYSIWSCLYFFIDFIFWGRFNLTDFFLDVIFRFFITGSYEHFWFFPALIFSVCITTLIYNLKLRKILIPLSIVLYVIGCLGCSYYTLGIQIPILRTLYASSQFNIIRRIFLMGFPFFVSGYFVYLIQERVFQKLPSRLFVFTTVAAILFWLVELCIVEIFKLQAHNTITFGLYPLVLITLLNLLKNPLSHHASSAAKARLLANFTYYSHPFFIMFFSHVSEYIGIYITETPMFFLTIIVTFIGGTVIFKLDNKLLNLLVR